MLQLCSEGFLMFSQALQLPVSLYGTGSRQDMGNEDWTKEDHVTNQQGSIPQGNDRVF